MLVLAILLGTAWEIYWTYHACWMASKLNDKKKFLFFLVFSLLGLPEIIYIRNKRKIWKPFSCSPFYHDLHPSYFPYRSFSLAEDISWAGLVRKPFTMFLYEELRSSIIRNRHQACWIMIKGMIPSAAYTKKLKTSHILCPQVVRFMRGLTEVISIGIVATVCLVRCLE